MGEKGDCEGEGKSYFYLKTMRDVSLQKTGSSNKLVEKRLQQIVLRILLIITPA